MLACCNCFYPVKSASAHLRCSAWDALFYAAPPAFCIHPFCCSALPGTIYFLLEVKQGVGASLSSPHPSAPAVPCLVLVYVAHLKVNPQHLHADAPCSPQPQHALPLQILGSSDTRLANPAPAASRGAALPSPFSRVGQQVFSCWVSSMLVGLTHYGLRGRRCLRKGRWCCVSGNGEG